MRYFSALILIIVTPILHAAERSKTYASFAAELEASITVLPYSEIAPDDKEDYFLVHFNGFEHKNDGQTMLYRKVWNNRDRDSGYYFQMAGTTIRNVVNDNKNTLIHGTLVPYSEVYLEGKAPIKVIYNGQGSDIIERKMLKTYQQRQGLTKSKVEAKRKIKAALASFNQTCNQELKVNIDWAAFATANQKTTPGMLNAYLQSLGKICTIDQDYKEAVNSITELKVLPSKVNTKHSVALKGNQLIVALDQFTPNVLENSYQAIFDAL